MLQNCGCHVEASLKDYICYVLCIWSVLEFRKLAYAKLPDARLLSTF